MLFWQADKNKLFHLKKGMMVDILPHVVQVVVLAPGSNTLLRVHYPKKNGEVEIIKNRCMHLRKVNAKHKNIASFHNTDK
jgi:hypothetical protein